MSVHMTLLNKTSRNALGDTFRTYDAFLGPLRHGAHYFRRAGYKSKPQSRTQYFRKRFSDGYQLGIVELGSGQFPQGAGLFSFEAKFPIRLIFKNKDFERRSRSMVLPVGF